MVSGRIGLPECDGFPCGSAPQSDWAFGDWVAQAAGVSGRIGLHKQLGFPGGLGILSKNQVSGAQNLLQIKHFFAIMGICSTFFLVSAHKFIKVWALYSISFCYMPKMTIFFVKTVKKWALQQKKIASVPTYISNPPVSPDNGQVANLDNCQPAYPDNGQVTNLDN